MTQLHATADVVSIKRCYTCWTRQLLSASVRLSLSLSLSLSACVRSEDSISGEAGANCNREPRAASTIETASVVADYEI